MLRSVTLLVAGLVVSARLATAAEPDAELRTLLAEHWEHHLQHAPVHASLLGDKRFNDRWTDYSLPAIEQRQRDALAFLARARAIDRAALDDDGRLNLDLFIRELTDDTQEFEFGGWRLMVDQRRGAHTWHTQARNLPFFTEKDYADWAARLRAYPHALEQVTTILRDGVARGIVQPRVLIQRLPAQIAKQFVDDPRESPFLEPYRRIPPALDQERMRTLEAGAVAAVREAVLPALRQFAAFVENDYLPACRESIGISDIPNGRAYYTHLARVYTTTELTPQEIHELGQREVARIRTQMEAIRQEVGFAGDLAAFFQHLQTDPRFFPKTSDEILTAYRALAKRLDPLMVRLFSRLPRLPYGVEPVPETMAPDTTAAYYTRPAADGTRGGTFWVNTYEPSARPKWEMIPLTLHEAVPGHHLQIALAQELGEIPAFRRYGGYTAYIEGWGLYAESLGADIAVYSDPYDRFGQLTFEMWRACRLVVDTGIHALGWSREQAIDFFKANTARAELDTINEIDRYIGNPGQALAYKIGELKFKELRARAAAAFGERFDLRAFHNVVLARGAVPLDLLERSVDEWIAAQRIAADG